MKKSISIYHQFGAITVLTILIISGLVYNVDCSNWYEGIVAVDKMLGLHITLDTNELVTVSDSPNADANDEEEGDGLQSQSTSTASIKNLKIVYIDDTTAERVTLDGITFEELSREPVSSEQELRLVPDEWQKMQEPDDIKVDTPCELQSRSRAVYTWTQTTTTDFNEAVYKKHVVVTNEGDGTVQLENVDDFTQNNGWEGIHQWGKYSYHYYTPVDNTPERIYIKTDEKHLYYYAERCVHSWRMYKYFPGGLGDCYAEFDTVQSGGTGWTTASFLFGFYYHNLPLFNAWYYWGGYAYGEPWHSINFQSLARGAYIAEPAFRFRGKVNGNSIYPDHEFGAELGVTYHIKLGRSGSWGYLYIYDASGTTLLDSWNYYVGTAKYYFLVAQNWLYDTPDHYVMGSIDNLKHTQMPTNIYPGEGGVLTSSIFDTGVTSVPWGTITWSASTPPSTSIKFQTRTSVDAILWSSWSSEYLAPGAAITSPAGRYIQYKAILDTDAIQSTPKLFDVTIEYIIWSPPEPPTLLSPPNGQWASDPTPTFSWEFNDIDPGDYQTAFQLQLDDDPGFSTVNFDTNIISSGTTSYTITNALPDGTWYWRVRVRDSIGYWSDWSVIWSVKIDTTPPPVPTMVAEPAYTQGTENTVSWSSVTDAGSGTKEYEVVAATNSDFSAGLISSGWITDTTYTFTSLTDGQIYYYHVRARDYLNLISSWSDAVYSTQDASPPPTPTMIPEPTYTQGSENTIFWGAVTDATSGTKDYLCQRATDPEFTTGLTDSGWITTTSFTFTGLLDGQIYYYRVCARDNVLNVGDWSAAEHSTQDASAPGTPEMYAEEPYTQGTENTVSWTEVFDSGSGVASYYCECATESTFTNVVQNSGWIMGTSYTFVGLTDGQTYYYRVRAKDNVGNIGAWSPSVASTQDASAPTTPSMDPEPLYTLGTTNAVYWSPALDLTSGVAAYECVRATNEAFTTGVWSTGWHEPTWFNYDPATDTYSYEFTGLSDGQIYYYRVRAKDFVENIGDWSNVVYSTQDALGPDPPTITAEPPYTPGLENTVYWEPVPDPSGISGYLVECAADAGFTVNVQSSGWITATSYTFTGLTDGQTYYYHVCAKDTVGNEGGWSDVVSSTQDNSAPPAPIMDPMDEYTPGNMNTASWSEVTDAISGTAGYYCEIADGLPFDAHVLDSSGWITTTSYTFTGLAYGTTYYYRVKAIDNVGWESDWSDIVNSTQAPPPEVYLESPLDGAWTKGVPTLSWTGESDWVDISQLQYDIYLGLDKTLVSQYDPSVRIEALYIGSSYTLPPGLLAGHTYYWTIRPYDGTNYGEVASVPKVWSFNISVDLYVEASDIIPAGTYVNNYVTVMATIHIERGGAILATGFDVGFYIGDSTTPFSTYTVPPFLTEDEVVVIAEEAWYASEVGEYKLSVHVDEPVSTSGYVHENYTTDAGVEVNREHNNIAERVLHVVAKPPRTSVSFGPSLLLILAFLGIIASLPIMLKSGLGRMRKQRWWQSYSNNNAGVSPVIGVILIVGMTIGLVAVLWLWVGTFIPTEKMYRGVIDADVGEDEAGNYYVSVKKVPKRLATTDVKIVVKDPTGQVKLSTYINDSMYWGYFEEAPMLNVAFHDSNYDSYISVHDKFYIRGIKNGGIGEYGGKFMLIHRGTGAIILDVAFM